MVPPPHAWTHVYQPAADGERLTVPYFCHRHFCRKEVAPAARLKLWISKDRSRPALVVLLAKVVIACMAEHLYSAVRSGTLRCCCTQGE